MMCHLHHHAWNGTSYGTALEQNFLSQYFTWKESLHWKYNFQWASDLQAIWLLYLDDHGDHAEFSLASYLDAATSLYAVIGVGAYRDQL